jgi:POT family proton-dependent oligopeptide transporter
METATAKHPKQLYLLFFTEMWERFSFYGMKALLLTYMVTQLKFDEPKGYAILGAYSALVYTMPMFGGMLADRFLGYRRAIIFGGVIMAIGHIVLAIPTDWSFFYGMAFIICGNGFFKPNISSMVGTLYDNNDPRKDSAFSLFYMGINVGAALGGVLCGYVGQKINWHLGFGIAGIFMILGLIIFLIGQKSFGEKGLPISDKLNQKIGGIFKIEYLIYGLTLLVLPLIVTLFNYYEALDSIMLILAIISVVYILFVAFKLEKEAKSKLIAALTLVVISSLFWAFYEQNAGSLNLFAIRNVDMHVFGVELPALSVNNFLPPAWVVILSLGFASLWPWLAKRKIEPSTPAKFALSFIFVAIGFLTFYLACKANLESGLIPLYAFAAGYFFIICGEMCISPVGLSMITKLSPLNIVGLMMGIFFFFTAIGEFLAGKIGAMMSIPKNIVETNNPVLSMPYYADVILQIAIFSAAIGVLMFLLNPLLKRWMGNIH